MCFTAQELEKVLLVGPQTGSHTAGQTQPGGGASVELPGQTWPAGGQSVQHLTTSLQQNPPIMQTVST